MIGALIKGVLLCVAISGCSFSAGGWSACFLDHSNLEITVSHPHGAVDPNAPN